ncbi:MAG: GPW/gp25 family protein [Bacteroidales bacterium]|nr:GPW/gp25 family protein [Bacteroidales bacterium]
MNSISIPLRIVKGGLAKTEDAREAIDSALALLMTTPCFNSAADPGFGFIFNNLRFEIFNEKEGVVFNSSGIQQQLEGYEDLYDKKISGSSNNLNTFAAELKQTIQNYETRLRNVDVTMSYNMAARKIIINVTGEIAATQAPYQYQSIINVWN